MLGTVAPDAAVTVAAAVSILCSTVGGITCPIESKEGTEECLVSWSIAQPYPFSSFFHLDHQVIYASVPSSFDVEPFDSSWSTDSPTSLCAGPITSTEKYKFHDLVNPSTIFSCHFILMMMNADKVRLKVVDYFTPIERFPGCCCFGRNGLSEIRSRSQCSPWCEVLLPFRVPGYPAWRWSKCDLHAYYKNTVSLISQHK